MEEVVDRLERAAEGNGISVGIANPPVYANDLRALLSERRKMVEALEEMILLAEVASAMITDRDLFKRTERRIAKARAALTGSREQPSPAEPTNPPRPAHDLDFA